METIKGSKIVPNFLVTFEMLSYQGLKLVFYVTSPVRDLYQYELFYGQFSLAPRT